MVKFVKRILKIMFNIWVLNLISILIILFLVYVIDMVYSEVDLFEGVGVG